MRDQRLTSLRNGVLAALGLLQACGGQVDGEGAGVDDAAGALTPGAAPSSGEPGAPLVQCEAMQAREDWSSGTCWEKPRYTWDGAHCLELRCGCAGSDCESAFGSVLECRAERGECDPLAAERAACIEQYPSQIDDAALRVSRECQLGAGINCDPATFISEGAAVCIAALEGLDEGLTPWNTGLHFDPASGLVVRTIDNLTFRDMTTGRFGGSGMALDANTGFEIRWSTWAATPGRPFLVDHAPRTAAVARRADYSAPTAARIDGIAAELRAALAAEWARVGLMEHASVAAFARFALQLLALGAPPELVEACQQAMQDELRHTRLAFGLASAYAEAPLGPGPLNLNGALDGSSDDLLVEVAIGTLVEGCIGETVAALDAREGATGATDPHVRQVLAEIAADEERHAELAWRFLDWVLGQRPALAALLLERARAQLARAPSQPTSHAQRVTTGGAAPLLEHGIVSLDQKLELEAQALEHVIVPCLVALARKHQTASPWGNSRAHVA